MVLKINKKKEEVLFNLVYHLSCPQITLKYINDNLLMYIIGDP